MVKNKKMSKTSIAVIVLALLLVLSLVMGMTGAWFTDKATPEANKSLNFGTININVTETQFGVYRASAELDGQDVMPGDYIKVNLGVAKAAAADEDFFWVVKLTATVNGVAVGDTGAFAGKTATTAFASNETMTALDFQLDPLVYGNTYQGQPVVVGYEVRAIQAANLDAAGAYTLLTGSGLDWSTATGTGLAPIGG